MAPKGLVWECECGNMEYGNYPPEECSECQAIDKFSRVPEDEIEEREAEKVLSQIQEEKDEEFE